MDNREYVIQFQTMITSGLLKDKLMKIRREAEERGAKRRAENNKIPYLNLAAAPINIEALALISEERAKELKAAAIEIKEDKLALAVFDVQLPAIKDLIKELETKKYKLSLFTVSLSSLDYAWSFYKFISEKQKQITGKIEIAPDNFSGLKDGIVSLNKFKETFHSMPMKAANVASVLEFIFSGALNNRASDIHFEPSETIVKLRLRIDGNLHDAFSEFKKDFYLYLVSRIKLLSNLKINVRDEAQDGRFTIKFPGKDVEVRVAVAPSEYGEVIVMRLLDPDAINLSLSDLGIREDDLEIIKTELRRPNGMILNTGPTGSGKTTTLYAFLNYKKNSEIKTITIEDPIEYHLEGIEQTQVDEEAGYTFANGLRSLMRQDPDVILVGEIRDKETGEIGIQAALTGHLVLSTIHANSAAGAIPRLLDLGVKSSSIGSALNLIIAQRLVRRLCQDCKTPQDPGGEFRNKIEKFLTSLPKRVNKNNYKEIKIFKPNGCDKCNGTGYKGRIAVYELLLNDPEYEKLLADPEHIVLSSHKELEELIIQQAGESAIKKFAFEQGMTTMKQDGILKIISGITTVEEVEGVTGPIEF